MDQLGPDQDAIAAIAERVQQRACILFLGAGVHAAPPLESRFRYPEAERPASGKELSLRLAQLSELDKRFKQIGTGDLRRVALDYELHCSRMQLVEQIKQAVHVNKRPSPIVRALAQLDFPIVITTNYDRLFEKALAQFDKDPIVSVYKKNEGAEAPQTTDDLPSSNDPSAREPFVVKIHGDIMTPESIVITDEDYIHFVMRMKDKDELDPIPLTFSFYSRKWPTLFIGYSLMDYNLRLLFKTMRWKVDKAELPKAYSVDLYPDPLLLKVIPQKREFASFSFIAQDVWSFVPCLYRAVRGEEMPT